MQMLFRCFCVLLCLMPGLLPAQGAGVLEFVPGKFPRKMAVQQYRAEVRGQDTLLRMEPRKGEKRVALTTPAGTWQATGVTEFGNMGSRNVEVRTGKKCRIPAQEWERYRHRALYPLLQQFLKGGTGWLTLRIHTQRTQGSQQVWVHQFTMQGETIYWVCRMNGAFWAFEGAKPAQGMILNPETLPSLISWLDRMHKTYPVKGKSPQVLQVVLASPGEYHSFRFAGVPGADANSALELLVSGMELPK